MTIGSQGCDYRVNDPAYGGYYGVLPWRRNWTGPDRVKTVPRVPIAHHAARVCRVLDSNGNPYVIPEYNEYNHTDTPYDEEHDYHATILAEAGARAKYTYGNTVVGNWSAVNFSASGVNASSYTNDNWSSSDQLKLVNKLRARCVGKWNPSQFAAGTKQTVQMIGETASEVRKYLRYLKTGQLRKAVKMFEKYRPSDFGVPKAETVSNAHLQLQYGWMPLLSDSFEGAHYLAQNLMPRRHTIKVRYRRALSCTESSALYKFDAVSSMIKGQLIAHISEDLPWEYITGLSDPESFLWEACPWSFVADWFIPIQTYLEARCFARTVKGQFVTTISKDIKLRDLRPSPSTPLFRLVDPYHFRFLKVDRTVSSTLNVALPEFKPLDTVPSMRRALNSLALLTQRFGSSPSVLRQVATRFIAPTVVAEDIRDFRKTLDDMKEE